MTDLAGISLWSCVPSIKPPVGDPSSLVGVLAHSMSEVGPLQGPSTAALRYCRRDRSRRRGHTLPHWSGVTRGNDPIFQNLLISHPPPSFLEPVQMYLCVKLLLIFIISIIALASRSASGMQ